MREFRERHTWKRIVYSRWTLLAVFLLSLLMLNALWHAYTREKASLADSITAQARLTQVEDRVATLQANVSELETPEGIDRQVRQKFNVVKPGEGVILIVGGSSTVPEATSSAPQKSWWQNIFDMW